MTSFCFSFGVRRTIYVLDSEYQLRSSKIRTGSEALGLTGNVWHQKYENKKGSFKKHLKYIINRLLKISLRLRYRNPDPVCGQNRILIHAVYRIAWWRRTRGSWSASSRSRCRTGSTRIQNIRYSHYNQTRSNDLFNLTNCSQIPKSIVALSILHILDKHRFIADFFPFFMVLLR